MYHFILIASAITMLLAVWNLVHSSPRSITMLLPAEIAFIAGAAMLLYGSFFAFAAAVLVQNGAAMLMFFVKAHVGFYLLLVHKREDEGTVRRAFVMMAAMVATVIGIFYTHDLYLAALLMTALLGTGYYVLTGKSRFLNPEG